MAIQVTKKAAELAERSDIDLKEVKGSGKGGRILLSDIEALIEETDEGEIIEVVDDEDEDWGDDEGEEAEVVEPVPNKRTSSTSADDGWGDDEEEEAEVVEEEDDGTALADSFSKEEEEKKEETPKAEKPKKKKAKPEPKFSGKTHTLYFEWVSVEPDANSYKPLKPQLSPMNVGVRIDVPEEYVIEVAKLDRENEMVFLSPEGMAYCAHLLAQATKSDGEAAKDDPNPENWDKGDSDEKFDGWAGEEGLDEDEGWDD